LIRAGEALNIKTTVGTNYTIHIYDANGKLVFRQNTLEGNQAIYPDLSRGNYQYTIFPKNGLAVEVGRVIVQ